MSDKVKKSRKRILLEYAEAIVTALILALLIRAYVVQAFKIPTASMVDTLLVGDHILVNKFIYGLRIPFSDERFVVFKEPQRGDIVVFKYPEDPKRDFIKRIVAVGGDVIEARDKVLYLNGSPLEESFVSHRDKDIKPREFEERDNFGPIVVPKEKFFVMGDNRDYSYDSRYWGFVDFEEIKGKALIIYWSWDSTKHLPRFGRITRLVHSL
jgi:signal peptidase I